MGDLRTNNRLEVRHSPRRRRVVLSQRVRRLDSDRADAPYILNCKKRRRRGRSREGAREGGRALDRRAGRRGLGLVSIIHGGRSRSSRSRMVDGLERVDARRRGARGRAANLRKRGESPLRASSAPCGVELIVRVLVAGDGERAVRTLLVGGEGDAARAAAGCRWLHYCSIQSESGRTDGVLVRFGLLQRIVASDLAGAGRAPKK